MIPGLAAIWRPPARGSPHGPDAMRAGLLFRTAVIAFAVAFGTAPAHAYAEQWVECDNCMREHLGEETARAIATTGRQAWGTAASEPEHPTAVVYGLDHSDDDVLGGFDYVAYTNVGGSRGPLACFWTRGETFDINRSLRDHIRRAERASPFAPLVTESRASRIGPLDVFLTGRVAERSDVLELLHLEGEEFDIWDGLGPARRRSFMFDGGRVVQLEGSLFASIDDWRHRHDLFQDLYDREEWLHRPDPGAETYALVLHEHAPTLALAARELGERLLLDAPPRGPPELVAAIERALPGSRLVLITHVDEEGRISWTTHDEVTDEAMEHSTAIDELVSVGERAHVEVVVLGCNTATGSSRGGTLRYMYASEAIRRTARAGRDRIDRMTFLQSIGEPFEDYPELEILITRSSLRGSREEARDAFSGTMFRDEAWTRARSEPIELLPWVPYPELVEPGPPPYPLADMPDTGPDEPNGPGGAGGTGAWSPTAWFCCGGAIIGAIILLWLRRRRR